MVSGYQAREFVLGLRKKLSPTIIVQINCARRNAKYISTENLILINQACIKSDINNDPILLFHAGVTHDGFTPTYKCRM